MCFNDNFKLNNVLHVPTFKFSLLSVGQLLKESKIAISFQLGHYVLHGLKTRDPIVVGFTEGGLYQLSKKSFDPTILCKFVNNVNFSLV